MLSKKDRRFLKRLCKKEIARKSHGDRYAVPLHERVRVGKADYEGYTEYGFYEDNGETDEEIRDFLNEEYRIPFHYEAWDCTGKPFTCWITFHRNPCGWISFQHVVGYDV